MVESVLSLAVAFCASIDSRCAESQVDVCITAHKSCMVEIERFIPEKVLGFQFCNAGLKREFLMCDPTGEPFLSSAKEEDRSEYEQRINL